jgi:hypothetical protein
MCDESLRIGNVPNPQKNEQWNDLLVRTVWDGCDVLLTKADLCVLEPIFGKDVFKVGMTVLQGYDALCLAWFHRWNDSTGTCTELMIRDKLVIPGIPNTCHNTLVEQEQGAKKTFVDSSTQIDTEPKKQFCSIM